MFPPVHWFVYTLQVNSRVRAVSHICPGGWRRLEDPCLPALARAEPSGAGSHLTHSAPIEPWNVKWPTTGKTRRHGSCATSAKLVGWSRRLGLHIPPRRRGARFNGKGNAGGYRSSGMPLDNLVRRTLPTSSIFIFDRWSLPPVQSAAAKATLAVTGYQRFRMGTWIPYRDRYQIMHGNTRAHRFWTGSQFQERALPHYTSGVWKSQYCKKYYDS